MSSIPGSQAGTAAADAPALSRSRGSANKKVYRRPRLTAYGDLRTLTLGGSPGMGDSGSTVMIRKPL